MFLLQHGSVPLSDLGVSGAFEEDDNDVATKVSGVRCGGVAALCGPSCIFENICLTRCCERQNFLFVFGPLFFGPSISRLF